MQRFFVPAGSVAPAADGQQGARPGVSVRWKWSTMRHVAGTPKPFGPASHSDGACGSTEHDDSRIEDFAPDIGSSPHAEEDEELPVETGNGLILRVLQEKPADLVPTLALLGVVEQAAASVDLRDHSFDCQMAGVCVLHQVTCGCEKNIVWFGYGGSRIGRTAFQH